MIDNFSSAVATVREGFYFAGFIVLMKVLTLGRFSLTRSVLPKKWVKVPCLYQLPELFLYIQREFTAALTLPC